LALLFVGHPHVPILVRAPKK